ncbi:hypothetical protein [Pelagibius sp. Alg239-R121]|uniref:hypothetical protein n=1 Tax=Pelagibius sp. Alg239-R121 TaxID=2993448 RepID=UPI0024A66867|nr:hypothetical protein [Pelagibius sp. Alg239-R121]
MKKVTCAAFAAGVLIGTSVPSFAASQDECAIWLCLPGGFPGGCEAAYAAFIKRINHTPKPKPPLPPFSSCDNGNGDMVFDWGFREKFRCEDLASEIHSGQEGNRSCRMEANNEQGYVTTPLIRDEILWTDVPSLGKEHRRTKYVWRSTVVRGGVDEGRR